VPVGGGEGDRATGSEGGGGHTPGGRLEGLGEDGGDGGHQVGGRLVPGMPVEHP